MQPGTPYRFTHMLGGSSVGKAWAAIDEQGRLVTVAVLDATVAATEGWREAFAGMANSLAEAPEGVPYTYADFSAAAPWVAYPAEAGPGAERLMRSLGVDYQPIQAEARAPVSAPPQPVSGAPQPVSGAPQPVSGSPVVHRSVQIPEQPASGAPHPISGAPASPGAPQVGTSAPSAGAATPVSAAGFGPAAPGTFGAVDPFDSSGGRRIVPVARPPRNRLRLWIGGVVLTALLAGGAGFFVGGALDGSGEPAGDPSVSASPPLYDATQNSLNKTKFDGDLMPLAEPWLAQMGGCAVDTEVGGPELLDGESRHVFCRYRGVAVHFARYESAATKEAARTFRQEMGIIGRALAPGLREATQSTGGSSGAPGAYVEYAGNGHDGRPVCGIWWSRDDGLSSLYLETPCGAGLGGNWDALRDLWHRNS
ncbi:MULTISPECIES: hypothetical protein [unclassified Micromonospora]|uniref:hypothetical protein n=1 Tax=unclassified Micromonospora TaxID=2617518 RepID=UPI0022B6BE4B|nr:MULTISPECIES: hypothetical protein [unclassified Micromonospora]MCZ7420625.1 hypothetical protein [Verrucosispora sp. WMMA2121]WBB88918.1 hypothetical protein O7597_17915 [Verrucosispora sp. WMMC514]